jgi:hypothetical protein
MTDAEFLAALEDASLPPAAFRHDGHIRAAYLYLRQCGFEGAIARMRAALIRYATAQGRPGLYHETITVAFLALVNERLRGGTATDWPAFAAGNRDLFDKRILSCYYRSATLESPLAREVFLLSPLTTSRDPGAIDAG